MQIFYVMAQIENIYDELDYRLNISETAPEWCDRCGQGGAAPLD